METIILGKIMLCAVGFGASLAALKMEPSQRLTPRQFTGTALGLLVLTRLAIYAGLFFVLKFEAQSDVIIYAKEARGALAGKVPFRDFFTAYGPLFPYVVAGPVWLWNSAKSIILFTLLLEVASLPLWLSVGRHIASESAVRSATLLYILNPFVLVTIPIGGSNTVWLSLFLAVTLWCMFRGQDGRGGLAMGAGIVTTKWLSLIHFPALWLGAKRRTGFTLGLVLLPVIIYGLWIALGGQVFSNVLFHAEDRSSGNLPFLLTITGIDIDAAPAKMAFNLLGLGILGGLSLLCAVRFRRLAPGAMVAMLTLLTLVLMIVSKKSFTSYLIMALFPLCLLHAAMFQKVSEQVLFLLFLAVAGLEPTLYFRWLDPEHPDFRAFWNEFRPQGSQMLLLLVFLFIELLLLMGYAYYAWQMWRRMVQIQSQESSTVPAHPPII